MATGQIPNWFVVIMGLGTVFIGLICIIAIISIMGYVVQRFQAKETETLGANDSGKTMQQAKSSEEMSPEEHRQLVAAISAVIAEELGTDISAIRICSMKKVS